MLTRINKKLLEKFVSILEYEELQFWIFVVAAVLAISVTFLTVIWQSLKTAKANPVESLRYE